jgi:hypothetical protein
VSGLRGVGIKALISAATMRPTRGRASKGLCSGVSIVTQASRWKIPVSGYWVARVVQAAVQAAGGDPALYAGHSLRSGLATAAAERGASERSIMEQTGHKASSRYAATYGVPRFFRPMPRLWPGSERVVEHEGR